MYNAHITRQHKGAIMLLIDQSGSMDEECVINNRSTTKARAVAAIANTFIEEVIDRSHRERGVGDYFDIAVIGYGGEEAKSLFGHHFRRITEFDTMYVPIAKYHSVRKLPGGENIDLFFKQRQWVEPVAKGRTPMGGAIRMARSMCAAWCRKHPQSFPPIVINISDGEVTDCTEEELLHLAGRLKMVATEDGNLLFLNIHLSSNDTDNRCVLKWPASDESLPNTHHAKLLYDLSSTLPPLYSEAIASLKGSFTPLEYRAVCYNTSCEELIGAIHIGSLSLNRMI